VFDVRPRFNADKAPFRGLWVDFVRAGVRVRSIVGVGGMKG